MPSNKIYKIANEIAPDRAAQGDHYDMKIDAIIKYLDGASTSTTGLSTPIANTTTTTTFDKTLTIPANVLSAGKTLTVKASFQTTSTNAGDKFTMQLLYNNPGVAAAAWETITAIDPADGVVVNPYLLTIKGLLQGTGSTYMTSLGGDLWDYNAAATTIVPPTVAQANLAIDTSLPITLGLNVTWTAANVANIVTLYNFSYNVT